MGKAISSQNNNKCCDRSICKPYWLTRNVVENLSGIRFASMKKLKKCVGVFAVIFYLS